GVGKSLLHPLRPATMRPFHIGMEKFNTDGVGKSLLHPSQPATLRPFHIGMEKFNTENNSQNLLSHHLKFSNQRLPAHPLITA
ncbi:MAG: hypothetical protein SPM31_05875, partial [Prevotella sp.]|nr:hypothetical protein [Prevotella sp.]